MLITFSPAYSATRDSTACRQAVELAATHHKAKPSVTFARQQERGQIQVRFTLPGASFAQHDDVIRALFELDPGAEIRTAKAHYHGRDDFVRQYKASADG